MSILSNVYNGLKEIQKDVYKKWEQTKERIAVRIELVRAGFLVHPLWIILANAITAAPIIFGICVSLVLWTQGVALPFLLPYLVGGALLSLALLLVPRKDIKKDAKIFILENKIGGETLDNIKKFTKEVYHQDL